MEIIKIKELEVKPSILIVKHDKGEHTLNRSFQAKECNFLLTQVKEGGTVEVELIRKQDKNNPEKFYNNITKVNDMTNWTMGVLPETDGKTAVDPVKKVMENISLKDERILAQVMLKGAIEMAKNHTFENLQDEAQYMCECIPELYGVYKVALDVQNE